MFTVPGGHPEGPGHIRIPAAEVRRLLGKGGQGAQVVGPSGVWVKPQPSEFLALLFWISHCSFQSCLLICKISTRLIGLLGA